MKMMRLLLVLPLALGAPEPCEYDRMTPEQKLQFPRLAAMTARACDDAVALAEEMAAFGASRLSVQRELETPPAARREERAALAALVAPAAAAAAPPPIVVAHGMGDSCFNRGMKSITELAGDTVGVYAVCVPTGDTWLKDTLNGFLLDMDSSVDVFAAAVRADPQLSGGFSAFGLSQGNNLIRGYIAKYNDPPVRVFMSINGINAGVGAIPDCSPQGAVIGGVCEAIAEVCGALAYNSFVQGHLFQADYFRDPSRTDTDAYKTYSQLAAWGNEGSVVNATFNANFAKTDKFVLVKGTEDSVVWPREGEWFGAMDPADPWGTVLPMNQTAWYALEAPTPRPLSLSLGHGAELPPPPPSRSPSQVPRGQVRAAHGRRGRQDLLRVVRRRPPPVHDRRARGLARQVLLDLSGPRATA